MIEHFADLLTPFADTMAAFPVDSLSVISGAEGSHEPIGPFHPHALALGKNDLLANAIASATGGKAPGTVSVPAAVPGSEPTTSFKSEYFGVREHICISGFRRRGTGPAVFYVLGVFRRKAPPHQVL
jgi:hypothetical protein